MAIQVTDLRNGAVYQEKGEPFQVLKYSHKKMGRGMATIRVKVKNLKSGAITEKTYSSGSKVEEADVLTKSAQFLYADGTGAVFMDKKTFEQFEISPEVLGNSLNFLTVGSKVNVILYESKPIGIELPKNVELAVTYAEPGVKGDTANTALIKVRLETGFEIMTPMFVKTGDKIKVDTRTGEYLERAK